MTEVVSTRFETDRLGERAIRLERLLGLVQRRLLAWFPRYKAVLLYRCGRRAKLIVATNSDRSTPLLLFLMALRGRRRVVLLDLMRAAPRGRVKRRLWPLYNHWLLSPAMRRAVVAAHVLTAPERDRYARLFGLPLERLIHIPYPLFRAHQLPVQDPEHVGGVVASGRACCDWKTLFAAARLTDWPLTVICGQHDLAEVDRLNADGRATRYCEIPPERHDRLVAGADMYVLCLQDAETSAGHIRLRTAIENRRPVAASDVRGLVGYVSRETARMFTPNDPVALRTAVEELLADAEKRQRLAESALHWAARERSFERYLDSMKEMFIALLRE